jgi:HEAT repeat protein
MYLRLNKRLTCLMAVALPLVGSVLYVLVFATTYWAWWPALADEDQGPDEVFIERAETYPELAAQYKGRSLWEWTRRLDSDFLQEAREAQDVLLAAAEDASLARDARGSTLYFLGCRRDLADPQAAAARFARLVEDDPDRKVRCRAAWALDGTGVRSPDLLRLLAGRYLDERKVNQEVADAIQAYGRDARPISPVLIPHLRHRDGTVRNLTMSTLASIGARDALPEIRRLLDDDDEGTRQMTREMIAFMEERAKLEAAELPVGP